MNITGNMAGLWMLLALGTLILTTGLPVWALLIEVADIDAQDVFELAATEDQEPVEALPAHAADPAFGVGIRVRRLDRRSDDFDAFAAEDAVEGAAELRVAVMDQEARPLAAVAKVHQQVASLLAHPRAFGLLVQATYSTRRVPIETKNSTYNRRSQTVSHGEQVTRDDRVSVFAQERSPAGGGAPGRRGMPARASTLRTSVADTVIPSLRNSPTIRT